MCAPQPQSTDFTQYNSYGDMCGGGRGEQRSLSVATEHISRQFHLQFRHQYSEMAHYVQCEVFCIMTQALCHTVFVDSSVAGDLTAKPLTVSLILCPMLSCRVSGMSLICFLTWHASSPRIIYLLARGLQETPCPECTPPTPATCLHHCWIYVNYATAVQ